MKTIAITGGIGAGKSSVTKILSGLGYPVISADEVAHAQLQKGTATYRAAVTEFGPQILDAAGQIDRNALGEIVFRNRARREELEAILHPAIIGQIQRQMAEYAANGMKVVFAEVPLLFEVGMESFFDQVWVVSATPETQIKRLGKRDSLDEARIRQRMAAQLPTAEKEARADQVIYNNLGLDDLEQQVKRLLGKFV